MTRASLPRPERPFASLEAASDWLFGWLAQAALPLWASAGVDPANGGFREALTWNAEPHDPRRRARVQARQTFVFAAAAAEGIPGPWLETARAGFDFFRRRGRGANGLFASALDPDGRVTDPTPRLYEHAFILLALSALHRADPADRTPAEAALAVREALEPFRHPAGGFREAGAEPFQANAHMHLLEAALAWRAVGSEGFRGLADEIAGLALGRFIDPATGALREFFDAGWQARTGEAGLIEPGHLFEWAWLLDQWGGPGGGAAARRLFAAAQRGVDPQRNVAVNALADDLSVRDAGARLWPQTERLKASVLLEEPAEALAAADSLRAYLDTPVLGVWRERMRADGGFVEEPSPATSLYHLAGAILALRAWVSRGSAEPC